MQVEKGDGRGFFGWTQALSLCKRHHSGIDTTNARQMHKKCTKNEMRELGKRSRVGQEVTVVVELCGLIDYCCEL